MTGPLTTCQNLTEGALFGSEADAAAWLAYVGLGGRYAAVPSGRYWRRWDGRSWQRCPAEEVNRAVRRALGTVYDRRMEAHPSDGDVIALLRLMDLNWTLGPLVRALRREVTVPVHRVGEPLRPSLAMRFRRDRPGRRTPRLHPERLSVAP